MTTWRGYRDDPPGYRLLVQLIDERTEAQARYSLVRIFGPAKGLVALLLAGSMQKGVKYSDPWVLSSAGFRAYLPEDYR